MAMNNAEQSVKNPEYLRRMLRQNNRNCRNPGIGSETDWESSPKMSRYVCGERGTDLPARVSLSCLHQYLLRDLSVRLLNAAIWPG